MILVISAMEPGMCCRIHTCDVLESMEHTYQEIVGFVSKNDADDHKLTSSRVRMHLLRGA